jgi:hypothetical protein
MCRKFAEKIFISKINNVRPLGEVAQLVTDYFPLEIKSLAKCVHEFTTKFAISQNTDCGLVI